MGWTSYQATHYKNNGTIDRKKELDYELFRFEHEGGHRLVKSSMVGATYYAAVKHPRGHVYGLVVLTQVDNRIGELFYKDMSEDMLPGYYDCPVSILKLLSPTDNECALEWRAKCAEQAAAKKSPTALNNLPIGAKISFTLHGEKVEAVKYPPAYQFKRAFWCIPAMNKYIKAKYIPRDYIVL